MKYIFLTLILCSFIVNNSFAKDTLSIDEISIGIGESRESIDIYRVGIKQDFKNALYKDENGWISGYYEASINYFGDKNSHTYGVALSPVFVYYFRNKLKNIQPYMEAGIGLSYISDTTIKTRNMGTHIQFENRIGFGIKTELYDLNTRYMHYSNANTCNVNDGIDIFIFTVSYKF